MSISDIDTIVIVIMENRSFDHMLGYRGLAPLPAGNSVEGLRTDSAWRSSYANLHGGTAYPLYRLAPNMRLSDDPTHDMASINLQIATAPEGPGPDRMGGFVESYTKYASAPPAAPGVVMGYYDQQGVPAYDFLAANYCICDHWFASLPLGTQANRLMAMAGESTLLDNASVFLPDQRLVYDWLTEQKISWCAYQSGDFLPFFSLMPRWLPEIATSLTLSSMGGRPRFRRYDQFSSEWQGADPMPSVIFIEPEYTDGPHLSANDDHAPTGVAPGQTFIEDIYRTLISNRGRWAKTMLVITYDEHGGFFDHVPPLAMSTTILDKTLPTSGVRVPAFVVSPFVYPGSVFKGNLDHTSLLQLLDDRFGGGHGYSNAVNARQSELDRLQNTVTGPSVPNPPVMPAIANTATGATTVAPVPTEAHSANAKALHLAAQKLVDEHPDLVRSPNWDRLREYVAQAHRLDLRADD